MARKICVTIFQPNYVTPAKVNSVLSLDRQQFPQATRILADLYWYVQVVEAGSFSRAAERTEIATSNLSRRIAQLERSLSVQLLNRSTRTFSLTTVGEQIYRHAIDMIAAAEAAAHSALASHTTAGGLIRLAAPSILADWSLEILAGFQSSHSSVRFTLQLEDILLDLSTPRLDVMLSLQDAPDASSAIVARSIARLDMVIVGSPGLLAHLNYPETLDEVRDDKLLALGAAGVPQPWRLPGVNFRAIQQPALTSDSTQTLLMAARAGLGLAYLPRCACSPDLVSGALQQTCKGQAMREETLYAMTPPHRAITATARHLIEYIRASVKHDRRRGIRPIS